MGLMRCVFVCVCEWEDSHRMRYIRKWTGSVYRTVILSVFWRIKPQLETVEAHGHMPRVTSLLYTHTLKILQYWTHKG